MLKIKPPEKSILHLNSGWYQNLMSKSLVFRCFHNSNVQYSDPHCIILSRSSVFAATATLGGQLGWQGVYLFWTSMCVWGCIFRVLGALLGVFLVFALLPPKKNENSPPFFDLRTFMLLLYKNLRCNLT